jgi:hypothetical protein
MGMGIYHYYGGKLWEAWAQGQTGTKGMFQRVEEVTVAVAGERRPRQQQQQLCAPGEGSASERRRTVTEEERQARGGWSSTWSWSAMLPTHKLQHLPEATWNKNKMM